jgi:hypothetical protein
MIFYENRGGNLQVGLRLNKSNLQNKSTRDYIVALVLR